MQREAYADPVLSMFAPRLLYVRIVLFVTRLKHGCKYCLAKAVQVILVMFQGMCTLVACLFNDILVRKSIMSKGPQTAPRHLETCRVSNSYQHVALMDRLWNGTHSGEYDDAWFEQNLMRIDLAFRHMYEASAQDWRMTGEYQAKRPGAFFGFGWLGECMWHQNLRAPQQIELPISQVCGAEARDG